MQKVEEREMMGETYLFRVWEEVGEERQHREVEADVPVGRVRLEDGDESDEGEGEQEGVLPQPDGERDDVDEDVELEGGDEEEAEVLEHLGEEVPEEPHVGRQLGHGEDEPVGGCQEGGTVCEGYINVEFVMVKVLNKSRYIYG